VSPRPTCRSEIKITRRGKAILRVAFLAMALLGAGCGTRVSPPKPPTADPVWFKDVTDECGLHFVHDAGPFGRYFLPQVIGSGAALFDYDNDGRLDIYLLQNAGPDSPARNRLFHQGADGRFTDVSTGSGLDIAGYNMGVAVGDVNNDGFPDVLVTQYGGIKLFLNNGNGTFQDVTRAAGLEDLLWGTSAAFLDYDRDGLLDLVVVHYVDYDPSRHCTSQGGRRDFCSPQGFLGSVTKLYHNRGPDTGAAVRFEDVTLAAGLGKTPGPGLGVTCLDFDGDGWPDIFVTNDAQANHLWINRHDGTFTEEALGRGLALNGQGQAPGNMGIAVGDGDGDGLLDLFVTHLTEENHTLWRQGPRGVFRDQTAAAGLARPRWHGTGFGTVFADMDHDGFPDLALVNGRVALPRTDSNSVPKVPWDPYAERNQLFVNNGKGGFQDISSADQPFCRVANVGRGLAWADLDGDGAIDLLVTAIAAPARLYRNVAPKRGHWLLVQTRLPALRRDAYGAEVTVEAGGRRWVGWVNPGSSYLCSNDARVHFGLGAAANVDAIRVQWPDGTREMFPGGAADRLVLLQQGEGSPAVP
jgi:hypothetical protein